MFLRALPVRFLYERYYGKSCGQLVFNEPWTVENEMTIIKEICKYHVQNQQYLSAVTLQKNRNLNSIGIEKLKRYCSFSVANFQ